MNTNTLTATDLHARIADEVAFYAPHVGVTDREGLKTMEPVYRDWLLAEARHVVYPAARFNRETQTFATDARHEARAERLAADAWAIIMEGVTRPRKSDLRIAPALSAVATPSAPVAKKAKAVAAAATRVEIAHRDDVAAEVGFAAARAVTKRYTAAAAAPVSGHVEEHMPLMDIFAAAALLEYLDALTPALAVTKDHGASEALLAQEAQDALSSLRDHRAVTQADHRAARKAAANGEEHAVLAGRSALALDDDLDSPIEDEVEGVWDAALPVFEPLGVRDAEELQVIISEMLGEKVGRVEGKKDVTLTPVALYVKGVEDPRERKAEAKRLRETVDRIRENVATVGPALRELLAA